MVAGVVFSVGQLFERRLGFLEGIDSKMKKTANVVGLVSIFTLALAGACSSSTSTTPAGTAGSGTAGSGTAGSGTAGSGTAGSGTAGSGTAGSGTAGSGTAGSGTAGSGTAGSGTAGSGGGTACAAPSGPAIDDFSGNGGLVGGMPYSGGDPGGANAPTFDTSSGAVVVTYNGGTTTSMYPYEFLGLGFSVCTDASAYTGVTFNISGALSTGCTIQFSAVDKEHSPVTNSGTCAGASCYPGGALFTLPATPTDVTIKFADQMQGGADPGAAPVDPARLLAIQWQVNPLAMMGCTGTVTIDNVVFQ